ncbi:glutathione S-transferase-like [Neocloeon triangulifer]|uniref:glutathione S-transferase-like n=1 Tax=Neocloeon triangulifer TaxID=2078957 RepID=UPI00286F271A|nr:glutathione S-transferase-like [Neocloeon triangulifer]
MSKTKLTYFGVTGRAEPIRYMLAYAGVDFEDVTVHRADLLKIKHDLPLGEVPVLEFEGKTLYQSQAIYRFLAKRFNLEGNDEWDAYWCDVAVQTIVDVGLAFRRDRGWEKTEKEKSETGAIAEHASALAKAAYFVDKLESQLEKNDGHFLKGKLSYADFYLAGSISILNFQAGENIFANKPRLNALKEKIENLPAIRAYLEKRPAVKY